VIQFLILAYFARLPPRSPVWIVPQATPALEIRSLCAGTMF
jgi:hypothetical protein